MPYDELLDFSYLGELGQMQRDIQGTSQRSRHSRRNSNRTNGERDDWDDINVWIHDTASLHDNIWEFADKVEGFCRAKGIRVYLRRTAKYRLNNNETTIYCKMYNRDGTLHKERKMLV